MAFERKGGKAMKANLRRFLTVMAVAVAGVLSVGAETVTPGVWCTDLVKAGSVPLTVCQKRVKSKIMLDEPILYAE